MLRCQLDNCRITDPDKEILDEFEKATHPIE